MKLYHLIILLVLLQIGIAKSQTIIYSFDANGSRIERKVSLINPNGSNTQTDIDSTKTHLSEEASFNICPNPSSSFITIETVHYDVNNEYSVTIFDKNGRKVYVQAKIRSQYSLVDISFLSSGLYTVKIFSRKKVDVFEILKQ